MVRAWVMDSDDGDQRLPHMTDPPEFVTLQHLKDYTGIEHWKIDADNYTECSVLNTIKRERGYTYEDEVNITEQMPGYLEKIKMFYEEHLHADDEIRLILDGTGYFDVRDKKDRWIRIELGTGDMITLPAGIYHRFTLDTLNFARARRYFIGEPVWTPHPRPADDMQCRKEYLKKIGVEA